MIKNYFKTTLRNLWKNKTYSFINIIGLSVGTLCCLYILLYVKDQYSYDKHHNHAKDIYRVTTSVKTTGDKTNFATASPPTASAMKNDFAEVEQFTRLVDLNLAGLSEHLLRYKDRSFYEKNAALADSTFFEVFTYHFIRGNASNALTEPYTVVLLKPVADKLFGHEDPLDKVIEIESNAVKHDFKVTGIVDESLGKSHIHASLFMTMNSGGIGQWVRNNAEYGGNIVVNSYVRLQPHASAAALEKKLPSFLNKYGQQQMKEVGMTKQLHLQPIASIHTSPGYQNDITKAVSPSFLVILLLIASLIQIIACINFMNLSTARASKRAKEVGVRKVMGAVRKDLIRQFLGESFLLSFIGVIISLFLLVLALPYLNRITNTNISFSFFKDYRLWLILTGLIFITGLIAGSYPAFYLSAFQAIKVIKGNFTNHISSAGIRRSLVVFQFVLSIVLITGIIVIYSQLNYIKRKDLGFEKDQKLVFSFHADEALSKIPSFINELRQLPGVKAVTNTNSYPGQFAVRPNRFVYLEGGNIAAAQTADVIRTDEYFAGTMGIRFLSGRDFRLQDSGKVLINETLSKALGLNPKMAAGTKLYLGSDSYYEIAGVLKDFNYTSLHENVKPLMIMHDPKKGMMSNLVVGTNSNNYKELLGKIESVWHKNFPALPFGYSFLDDEVQKQYETEIMLSRIINSFTLMAILISCLGLFGLVSFSAEQRTKEIGVRKVLGASIFSLTTLLSRDFLKLVVVAILAATPIAWWAMNKWLQAFAYRINISWWMFALAGFIAILIALFTVSFQAIKAAIANPVRSLRSE